ncbi:MAG: AIR synthase-related protein, partial [Polyangiales bacterium]
ARKVVDSRGAKLDSHVMELGRSLGDALMAPTRLYAKPVRAVLEASPSVSVKAMSHITGGGLPGNLPRVLPEGLGIRLDLASFHRPKVFDVLASLGPVEEAEMRRAFNLGLGFVMIVGHDDADRSLALLRSVGEDPRIVGEVIAVDPKTEFEERVVFVNAPPK